MARATDREGRWLLTVIVCLLVFLAFTVRSCIMDEEKRMTTWTVVAEGAYDRVEYGHYDHTWQSSHGAVHHENLDATLVFFDDGRTSVLEGRIDMPLPKGTRVRILKNGFSHFKVEKLDEP